MITCTRRIQFCSGHRVYKHESKCARLHGHNYVALVTCEAPELDALGRVIDFGVIKARVGAWIEDEWDHRLLLWDEDPLVTALEAQDEPFVLVPFNPTAERMAEYLLRYVCTAQLKDTGVRATAVRLWETENCYADATFNADDRLGFTSAGRKAQMLING